jgi:fused signal recognition particle receptor
MARLFRRKDEDRKSLWDRIVDVALTDVSVLVTGMDEGSLEGLEETLIAADFGVPATLRLVGTVETLAQRGVARSQQDFLRAVREEIVAILRAGRSDTALRFDYDGGPTVFLVVGVNGVGKTTTIAKLAHRLTRQGRKVMIAAGDTFRAGAIEQLRRWAERVGCDFVGARPVATPPPSPSTRWRRAEATGADVLIIDTAGRLHTQGDLMKELEKVHRVIAQARPRRSARDADRARLHRGTERPGADPHLRPGAAAHRHRAHQAGRNREGRDRGGAEGGVRPSGQVRGRRRDHGRPYPFDIETFAEEVLTV